MTRANAQPQPQTRFSVKCFGVGDGWPSADRDHSSFLYRFEGQSLLIDCGEPISRSFKATGLGYDAIDRILISHLHFDHVGGFFMLMQGFWLEARRKDLPVHMPEDGIEPVRQLLQAGCIFDELLKFQLTYEPLRADQTILSGPVRITPYPTGHLFSLRDTFQAKHPQRYEAFSFLMETGSLRIGHSADIGAAEDLAPLVENPLDLLVCELAHVEPESIFQFLQGRPIRQILFIHLARECVQDFETVEARAVQLLGAERIEWAKDGQEYFFDEKDQLSCLPAATAATIA